VHVSELSWKHVDHPSEVVQVGQEVEVEVLDVDLERERVSLSLKATQEDPWREFERQHQTGEVIAGSVTKLVPFGAFVRLGEGIEGLVHISELSEQHVESPEQVVQVGEQVRVKVVDVDVPRRRISLSMRRAGDEVQELPEPEITAESTEELVADQAPEPSAETREVLEDAEARGDESTEEVLEATVEPEPAAPEEAAMHVVPETEEPKEEAGEDEDISLESIVEELKRREGRG
jgi:small subunit ribosomal protein S1